MNCNITDVNILEKAAQFAACPNSMVPNKDIAAMLLGSLLDLSNKVSSLTPFDPANPGYTLIASSLGFNPTGGQTFHFGSSYVSTPLAADGVQRVYAPKGGLIKAAFVYGYANGTAGSGESWSMSVRLNSTSDTLIENLSVANATRVWKNENLNIAVVAGDWIEIKTVTPAWATSPTAVRFNAVVYIE
jgi:hypothetical protein